MITQDKTGLCVGFFVLGGLTGAFATKEHYESKLTQAEDKREEWAGNFIAMDTKARECIEQAKTLAISNQKCIDKLSEANATTPRAVEALRGKSEGGR